ncbi:MAG: hypothetical protein H7Z12_06705 [Rhodospirillaceae bacterium]|nr:hypothetical protein [Rhodospirillales bacterium]
MKLQATVMTAAVLTLFATGAAQAQGQGIITCQITLSQFAEDVYTSKSRLQPGQLAAARQAVDVGRSQCRSTPALVNTNVQSLRQQMALSTGRQTGVQFDDFWPADQQELSLLR